MTVEISEEIVTAAARAAYEVEWGVGSFDKPKTSEFERETYKIQARAALEAVAPLIANAVLERARELAKPHGPRPCDCEQCYCDNPDAAAAVAVWDAQRYIDDAIRALKEPTPRRKKPLLSNSRNTCSPKLAAKHSTTAPLLKRTRAI